MTKQPSKPLRVDVERTGEAAVVRIIGSAVMAEVQRLGEQIEDLVRGDLPLIVLDISGMEFISSAGLGVVISAHLRARKRGAEVRLACPRPAVAQLLEVTRLTRLFGIFPSVQEALEAPRTEEAK